MIMDKRNLKAFIDAVKILRDNVSDEKAVIAVAAYPQWKTETLYATNDRVVFEDILYRVLMDHVSQADWTPVAAPSLFAKVLIPDEDVIYDWEQPESTNGYMTGDKVNHNGKTWISNCDNNIWEPGVYGWDEVVEEEIVTPDNDEVVEDEVITPDDEIVEEEVVENTIPYWAQPDSTNPYMIGDRVMYNDQIWVSTANSNVWEPGIYGWEIAE